MSTLQIVGGLMIIILWIGILVVLGITTWWWAPFVVIGVTVWAIIGLNLFCVGGGE